MVTKFYLISQITVKNNLPPKIYKKIFMAAAVFLKNAAAMPFSGHIIILGTFCVHAGQIISTMLYSAHKIVKGGI